LFHPDLVCKFAQGERGILTTGIFATASHRSVSLTDRAIAEELGADGSIKWVRQEELMSRKTRLE